ncbi:MAG: prealbumin-like fold domain-containing protein, partial [Chloroflexi bacterium]|nr:prealbumin-like fold domain-containing protein [Chloroflexota bacterium]
MVAIALLGLFAAWGGTILASRDDGGDAGVALISVPYPADLNLQSDVCQHDQFIWGRRAPHNILLKVMTQEPNLISITGPEPFVEVHGTRDGDNFFATGMGTVAGIENVTVAMQGTWDGQTLIAKYAMGANGELPPCGEPPQAYPAVYGVKPKPRATPTPTPTPEEKIDRITILKRNDDTKEGLPGWQFNIYAGPNCDGTPFASGVTDANGIIEFAVPVPGQYSVEEKLEPGWNNVSPLCLIATAGTGGAEAAAVVPAAGPVPPCPIPNGAFPLPGCDEFGSLATVKVDLTNPDLGEFACDLSGPTQIVRHAVENKPPDSIDTEIVFMKLTGSCEPGGVTITVRESPTRASTGRIVEQQNSQPGTLEFPANSFFDVYFEVVTPAGTFHNET